MFQAASAAAIVATATMAVVLTVPGRAEITSADMIFESTPIIQSLPAPDAASIDSAEPATVDQGDDPHASDSATLHGKVADLARADATDAEHHCLAVGVYYESRSEPLEGQLAVAQVILNRVRSGRFAPSVCGVLTQPSQFSFVRRGVLPSPGNNAQWRTAVGVASVALSGDMASPVPGAMFFHATHVSPRWNRQRVARLGNHVFYR